jgi:hypothetical protein
LTPGRPGQPAVASPPGSRHFSATFNGIAGDGQLVDFVAFGIRHVGKDRLVKDWHLEDNPTSLARDGVASVVHG